MEADAILNADWLAPVREKAYRRGYVEGWHAAWQAVPDGDNMPDEQEAALDAHLLDLMLWRDDDDFTQHAEPPSLTAEELQQQMAERRKGPLTYADLVAKWGQERLDKIFSLLRTAAPDQRPTPEESKMLRDLGRSELATDCLLMRIKAPMR